MGNIIGHNREKLAFIDEQADGERKPRNRKRSHRGTKITVLVIVLALLGGVAFAAFQYLQLQFNMQVAELNAGLDEPQGKPAPGGPLNILIIGTDTRSGQDKGYGGEGVSSGEGLADVMMLLSVSANRQRASLVSFPRDLMVPFEGCRTPTGEVVPKQDRIQLNSSLALAGPGCTVSTISKLTGVTINHFMEADFRAVKELSTLVGGVDVCVQDAVSDPGIGLDLPAGTSPVSGDSALAFLRTRHAFGDGSDLGRIQAQQVYVGSMVQKLIANGSIKDVPKLYQIATVMTKHLTVDPDIRDPAALLGMGKTIRNIPPSKVSIFTAPTEPDPRDKNRVILRQPLAGNVFAAIRRDQPISDLDSGKAASQPSSAGTPGVFSLAGLSAPQQSIRVILQTRSADQPPACIPINPKYRKK